MKKLVVGKGITAIGHGNFSGCENLTEVVLPKGLETLDSAFSSCTSLTEITIPADVTDIAPEAFTGCTGLTEIKVEKGNQNYKSEGGVLFEKNGDGADTWTLHAYPGGITDSEYDVPGNVTTIQYTAFNSAVNLTKLALPESLNNFVDSSGDPKDALDLPTNTKLAAFEVKTGNTTFFSDEAGVLFKINTDGTLTLISYPPARAGTYAVSKTIDSKDVTVIAENAFSCATALTSVTIPESVKTIDRCAFTGSGLTEITLPASVKNLGYNSANPQFFYDGCAFEGCQSLTKFNVVEGNKNYKSIDGVLFAINTADTDTGETGTEGTGGAENNTGGESTTENQTPVELTLIRYPAARGGLYTVPTKDDADKDVTVTAIGRNAFESALSLTGVSIPEGVTTIGVRAFTGCSNLVSVFFPASLKEIGALALENCHVLKDVYYAGSEGDWENLTVPECNTYFSPSELDDELKIPVPEDYKGTYGSFSEMYGEGEYNHAADGKGWEGSLPLTNNLLLLNIVNNNPTFHYGSDGTVKITLDPNGGTLRDGTASWTTPHFKPSEYTPPSPTRAGYSFVGWTCTMDFYDPEGDGVSTVTRIWNWADPVYADMTLTASWSRDDTSYSVTLPKAIENGAVKSSHRHAEKGELVTLTITPDKGFALESLTLTDKKGNAVELTDKGNGTFTFKMPEGEVTVNVRFAPDGTMKFVDVPTGSYFYGPVLWAVENGITGGVDATHFMPHNACTRAQIVTFLWRAAGSPEPKAASSFSDVSASAYYAKAVAWAVENNITTGVTADTFCPDQTCTRAQAAAFLFRYAQSAGLDVSAGGDTNILSFNDAFDVPEYAVSAFQWAVGADIVNGNDGNLMPNNTCTRAQIVTMLYRLLGK